MSEGGMDAGGPVLSDAGDRQPRLVVQSAPFLRQGVTTPGLMRDVLLAVAPVLVMAVLYFGISALLVCLAATLGAMATESLFAPPLPGRSGFAGRAARLTDGSALLTGVLLGLTLPPSLPLWMAFLGGVVGIGLGKLIWGGLGHNLFNPALVGRAFLQAAFPISLTTWSLPSRALGEGLWTLRPGNFARPHKKPAPQPDAMSAATPLNLMKFDHQATALGDLLRGQIAGSLGETSAAVILLAAVFLIARRAFDWRIPVSILVTVAAFSGSLWLVAPERYPSPLFMLLSGGLMFGAVFMATDPVTSPLAPRGAWIFGVGVGVLVVLIRVWGGMPEGVMYAILLMNGATPLVERVTQQRAFGHRRSARKAQAKGAEAKR